MYQNPVLQISDYRPTARPLPVATVVTPETSATVLSASHPDAIFFRMLESKGLYLNQQQTSILTSKAQHMIINALAGTGKTSCIVALAAYLISMEGYQPENLLLLAYTKKSAQELEERIRSILPQVEVNVCTIHSLCYRILRSNGYKHYNLLTEDYNRFGIIKSILREKGYAHIFQAESLLSLNSYFLNTLTQPNDGMISQVLKEYSEYKEKYKQLEFDDILMKTYELLKNNERLVNVLRHRFKCIIVDEVQDLNPLQYGILKQLCSNSSILYCFGDKNQSIFSFRGSMRNIMNSLKRDLPQAEEINMNINYRCTAPILGIANKMLDTHHSLSTQLIATKPGNKLPLFIRPKDSVAESKYIVTTLQQTVYKGIKKYSDHAILFRSSTAASAVIEELLVNNIPFITSGASETIYQHSVSKLLIAHLRLAVNQSDLDSFINILSTLYLSKVKVLQHLNRFIPCDATSPFEIMLKHPDLEDYQFDLLNNRRKLLNTLDTYPAYALQQLYTDRVIQKHLNITGVSVEACSEVAQEILNQLLERAYQHHTIKDFLIHVDEVLEKSKERSNDEITPDAINVMSIHASKGLEFPVVYLIGAIEGVLPHKNVLEASTSFSTACDKLFEMNGSLEEERRLMYVAVTRAKEELVISSPYYYNGSSSRTSRFLESLSEHFVKV